MHAKIIEEVESMEKWKENVKDRDGTCYQLDTVKKEVEKLEGVSSFQFSPYSYAVEVRVFIKHTKHIERVLRVFCKHFGRIKTREIIPETKKFAFTFADGIRLDIVLTGTACKRVKVRTEKVDVDIYELHCENGEETVINDFEISKELLTDVSVGEETK